MDIRLRELERRFNTESTLDTLLPLLREYLRIGDPIELTDPKLLDFWEFETLQQFLQDVHRTKLSICNYPVKIYAITRTFLIASIKTIIEHEIDEIYSGNMYQGEAPLDTSYHFSAAIHGNFNLRRVAFRQTGDGCGEFYATTIDNNGLMVHTVEIDCDSDREEWQCSTMSYTTWWNEANLSYDDDCSERACNEAHFGTEDHVFAIDENRDIYADRVFEEQLEMAAEAENPYLDLKIY